MLYNMSGGLKDEDRMSRGSCIRHSAESGVNAV